MIEKLLLIIMQNILRPKTQNSTKRISQYQHAETIDLTDLISPWNNSDSRMHELSPSRYPPFATKAKLETLNAATENLRRIKIKNLRIKTEQVKDSNCFHDSRGFGQKNYQLNDNNFFTMSFINTKTGSSTVKMRKNYNTKTRQKFKTPVVNLNEYSFTQKLRQQFQSIIPRAFNYDKVGLKTRINKQLYRPLINESQFFSSMNAHKAEMRSFLTQKMISLPKSSLNKQNFNKKVMNRSINKSELLPESLKKIMESEMQPVIKKIKSKSLNKFNKTCY